MNAGYIAPAMIIILLTANTAGFYSPHMESLNNIKENCAESVSQDENIVNIGEVFAEMCGFGFINHDLLVYDKNVKWSAENDIIKGTVEMNYSLFYLFDKKLPRFMATGFSVYYHGKNIGKNHIFTISKNSKSIRGTLSTNVSFEYEENISLTIRVWFWCFPPHPLNALTADPSSHGILNWISLGALDVKTVKVRINVEKEDFEDISNMEEVWLHTGCNIRNTGFTDSKGEGRISTYRIKIAGIPVIGMGAGEPKVADIDKDGKMEIIFGTQTGYLYSIEEGKRVDWKCLLDAPLGYMCAEVGDIDGNGDYEVVVPSDNMFESETSGLRIVDGNGEIMAWWKNPEGGFPLGDPRVADIDGDGKDEILAGLLGDDKRGNDIYALSYENGSLKVLWKYQALSWVQFPAAVADIDNDGKMEILFSSHDMCIYCLSYNGTLRWGYITKGGLQPIYPGGFRRILFEPVVCDMDNDGDMEILVDAYLCDKPEWSALYCLNKNGSLVWKYEPGNSIFERPSVGDINNDGKLEVLFGDIMGNIYALDNEGNLLWKKTLPQVYFKRGVISGSPPRSEFTLYTVDLNGDGKMEIVATAFCHGIFILNGDGKILKQWPRPLGLYGYRGAAIADIDGDGDLEILFGVAGKTEIMGKLGIIDQIK